MSIRRLSSRLFSFSSAAEEEKDEDDASPTFLSSPRGPQVAAVLERRADRIHDDSFLKIVRQLEFWHADRRLDDGAFLALAERLARIASWREDVDDARVPEGERFRVPRVRFGRTELQMPIVTCGGMRIQETWIPDNLPLLKSNKSKVVKSASQANLKDVILCCLKVGLNHFETARMYGSSEIQFVDALSKLIEDGTIQRSDFIFQTKLLVGAETTGKDLRKLWEASWSNVRKIGHADLVAFHLVSKSDQIDNVLSDADDGPYKCLLDLKEEGKIKHIGFSTHGSAENVMRMIESNKFSYVNLHKHYFGDYHAAGTPDGRGGEGLAACVRRALESDMGVFCISPFDKGGKLYRPSAAVASAVGPGMSPIAFAALHAWRTRGVHTVSVGLARSSDLDEVIEAARIHAEEEGADAMLKAAEGRLRDLAVEKLGREWYEKGLLNVPSFFDETTDGMAVGHMLWLHNCLTAYGMWEFASDRYRNLKTTWNKSKSFEENVKKNFGAGNPGRAFDPSVDLTEALRKHHDPELAKAKLAEVHDWLNKDSAPSEEERAERGWERAYNLTTWEEFPGEVIEVSNVVLTRMGLRSGGGKSEGAVKEAKAMRGIVRRSSLMKISPDD